MACTHGACKHLWVAGGVVDGQRHGAPLVPGVREVQACSVTLASAPRRIGDGISGSLGEVQPRWPRQYTDSAEHRGFVAAVVCLQPAFFVSTQQDTGASTQGERL